MINERCLAGFVCALRNPWFAFSEHSSSYPPCPAGASSCINLWISTIERISSWKFRKSLVGYKNLGNWLTAHLKLYRTCACFCTEVIEHYSYSDRVRKEIVWAAETKASSLVRGCTVAPRIAHPRHPDKNLALPLSLHLLRGMLFRLARRVGGTFCLRCWFWGWGGEKNRSEANLNRENLSASREIGEEAASFKTGEEGAPVPDVWKQMQAAPMSSRQNSWCELQYDGSLRYYVSFEYLFISKSMHGWQQKTASRSIQ